MASIPFDAIESPSLSRRQLLNFFSGSALAVTAGGALYPTLRYFTPLQEGSVDGAILAKDKLGHSIPAAQLLAEPPGTRALVAGVAGKPTYLTVQEGMYRQQLHPPGLYLSREPCRSSVSMSLSWLPVYRGRRSVTGIICPAPGAGASEDRSRVHSRRPLDRPGSSHRQAPLVDLAAPTPNKRSPS